MYKQASQTPAMERPRILRVPGDSLREGAIKSIMEVHGSAIEGPLDSMTMFPS